MHNACPNTDILSRFANATLSDHEAVDVVAHLALCEVCSRKVDELEHFPKQPILASLRELQNEPIADNGDPPLPRQIAQYEILEKIGSGGMGIVYRAVHPHLKREVALKVIRDSRLDDPSARERFVQEMQSLGKLTHPNIVHATDAGIDGDMPFIVTELLNGQDFGSYIEEHGKMPVKQAVDCIRQAATGLAYAHKAGYVHRDIKPSNLFLCYNTSDQQERVNSTSGSSNRPSGYGLKILDLGIARPMADSAGQTVAGHVVGSPEFMAPELLRGGTADARSDIYSLGQTFANLLHEPIPSKLKPILARMTAGLPDQRYQTINDVIADLDAVSSVRSRTVMVIVSLLLTMALICFSVFAFMRTSAQQVSVDSATSPLPTIAVFEFDANTPDESLGIWRQGMRDMLATDITRGKRLQIVERSRLHDLLAEHQLTDTPFIDQKTAVELGKGLAAHWIIVGSFLAFGENMRIDARIVSVEKGTVVAAESVNGKKDDMLELEKRLAEKILTAVNSLYPSFQARSVQP